MKGGSTIAIIPGKHEMLLTEFKERVCQNPDGDFTSDIQVLAAEFRQMEREREIRVIYTFFLNLYAQDAHSLKRDLAKIAVFGTAQAMPNQRITLLRCLYGVVALYIHDGFSEIIAMCEQAEDSSSDLVDALG